MQVVAHGDFENGGVLDLTKVGAHRIAEDPETRIWMLSWRLGDGPVRRWHPGQPDPQPLLDHVAAGGRFVGHNVTYERLLWNYVLRTRPEWRHWPELRIAQCDDTMARALAIHLPADLDTLGKVLGLAHQKDKTARSLMLKMARPRKIWAPDEVTSKVLDQIMSAPDEWTSRADGTWVQWWNTPENVARLGTYCDDDVLCESDADARLPPLSPEERELWERDQAINDRGVALDVATIERAVAVKEVALRRADAHMAALTGGEVRRCTESGRLVAWLAARGLPCTSIAKDEHDELRAVAEMLGDVEAVEVIGLRAESTKTSVAKYNAMLDVVCADGRARGLFGYHRALTGRFGGMKIQPQNLPRVDEDEELPKVLAALRTIEMFNDSAPEALLDALERDSGLPIMVLLSKMLRSMFVAPHGKMLVGGDFSNIEGRVNAWLAGEQWKLDAFRAYDAKTGPDLYRVAYAKTFGVAVESVTKAQRQLVGKPEELACGFQGSVGAFLRFVKNVDAIVRVVRDASYGDDKWLRAAAQHDRMVFHNGLARDQWIAIKVVVNGWRENHPKITQSWWDRQDGVLAAVDAPGTLVHVMDGKVRYLVADGALWARLPSGKLLAYQQPRIVEKKDDWLVDEDGNAMPAGELAEDEIAMRIAAGATLEVGKRRTQVRYQGKNQKTGQWGFQHLYGGVLCNNDTQGTARELLRFAIGNVENAGYPVALHVHDEPASEIAEHMADGADARYEELMSILPPWLEGLPLAAKAWTSTRYVK